MTSRSRILIVEDAATQRTWMKDSLAERGFEVVETSSCASALGALGDRQIDAAVIDHILPDGTALELLPRLKELAPQMPVVVLTAHGSIDLAVRAVHEGADHFLTKPVELPALTATLERLIDARRELRKGLAVRTRRQRRFPNPFLGTSRGIRELQAQAQRVAGSDRPVLVQGETGTGKGVLSWWLHENSPRAEEPFVDLNCAGLTREFLETELFGHEKGAFTGAAVAKLGLLEVADRGTLFLDEIADMDPLVQPKLLKVLEEGRFRRMGAVQDRVVDVRLIAASHQDFARLVREKRFRQDLFFRVSTLPLVVPPLRERTEDIPVLIEHLLERIAADVGRPQVELTPAAIAALQAYSWPGNVRELRNLLERAVLLREGKTIGPADLRFEKGEEVRSIGGAGFSTNLTLSEVEKRHIADVLESVAWNVVEAARVLDVPRSSLYQRIKKLGLQQLKTGT
jgi:DNA-binding NtrC family response regulator